MAALPVPKSVRQEMGAEAALDVSIWLAAHKKEWSDEVLNTASDRFARVLAEESAKIRGEIANAKFEILKWSFLFWLGQVAVVAGLISWMFRGAG